VKDILTIKLLAYLKENNPDVLFSLQQNGSLLLYLHEKMQSVSALLQSLERQNKPPYIIEEICLNELTSDLRPSKYHYIREVFEEDFAKKYQQLLQPGILRFEIINIISACKPVFEAFGFSEGNEDDKNLRYAIIGVIREYFENSESENRVVWPTMPTINL
jgi:hypothetical protein